MTAIPRCYCVHFSLKILWPCKCNHYSTNLDPVSSLITVVKVLLWLCPSWGVHQVLSSFWNALNILPLILATVSNFLMAYLNFDLSFLKSVFYPSRSKWAQLDVTSMVCANSFLYPALLALFFTYTLSWYIITFFRKNWDLSLYNYALPNSRKKKHNVCTFNRDKDHA